MEIAGDYSEVNLVTDITSNQSFDYVTTSLVNRKDTPPDKFLFSMQYWKQIDLFGLSSAKTTWFISVLERLKKLSEMSSKGIELLLSGGQKTHSHCINWNQSPITRKELDWIPKEINEDEIVQINISIGKGRIIGFFEECVFYVVLLDEKHNMQSVGTKRGQPSKTIIGDSQYDKLEHKYVELTKCINKAQCVEDIKGKLEQLKDKDHNFLVSCELDEEYYTMFMANHEKDTFMDLIKLTTIKDLY